jgi:hypothetical protein
MESLLRSFKSLFCFYSDGFRNMSSWGKKAWLVIIIKLFIIFVVLRIFFFHDFLGKRFDNDSQRSEYVRNQILKSPDNND